MKLGRKIELSLYYYLQELLPDNVKVVLGYDFEELTIPSVAIEGSRYNNVPIELGNRVGLRRQIWVIDIFADTKQQRDDLAEIIYDAFLYDKDINDYEIGFPQPTPPQLGVLEIMDRSSDAIIVFRGLVEKFYWRRKITLSTQYREI